MVVFDIFKIIAANERITSEIDSMLEDDIDVELEDWGPDLMRSLCLDCARAAGTDFIAEHVLNTDLRIRISNIVMKKEFTLSELVSQFIFDNDKDNFIYMLELIIAENFYNLFQEDIRYIIDVRRSQLKNNRRIAANDYD